VSFSLIFYDLLRLNPSLQLRLWHQNRLFRSWTSLIFLFPRKMRSSGETQFLLWFFSEILAIFNIFCWSLAFCCIAHDMRPFLFIFSFLILQLPDLKCTSICGKWYNDFVSLNFRLINFLMSLLLFSILNTFFTKEKVLQTRRRVSGIMKRSLYCFTIFKNRMLHTLSSNIFIPSQHSLPIKAYPTLILKRVFFFLVAPIVTFVLVVIMS